MANTFFGAHVHRGAFIIAIVGILASILTIIFYMNEPAANRAYLHLLLTFGALLVYLAVAVGNNFEQPGYYWPFLLFIVSLVRSREYKEREKMRRFGAQNFKLKNADWPPAQLSTSLTRLNLKSPRL